MAVFKALDIDAQDLQDMVRNNRNVHHNTPYANVDPEEAELDQRQQLITKVLRAGWIPPTYTSEIKLKLLKGEGTEALQLLCDVLGVDADTLPESALKVA